MGMSVQKRGNNVRIEEHIIEELKKTNALLQQQINDHAAWIQRIQEREEMLDIRDEAWKAEMRAGYARHDNVEQERLALDRASQEDAKKLSERFQQENMRYARERDGAMMALALAADKYSIHAFTANDKRDSSEEEK